VSRSTSLWGESKIYLESSDVSLKHLILHEATTVRHLGIRRSDPAGGYAEQVERSLLDSPSYRLIRALGRHKALIAGELERHGLHLGQEFYLAQLWREDGITSADLAARTGVSAPAVTKVVNGLERAGLVRRERDPADARLVRVWMTEAGNALQGPVTAIWYDAERRFWGGLGEEERALVRDAVGTLLD
jgi:DNA-binding MarR family transcriptional regulator